MSPRTAPPPVHPPVSTIDDPRWALVVTRDRAADGAFVYSVRTTGVYCRPSCPSRAAKPAHVRFHADADAAARAGFRACRRCRPDRPSLADEQAALVASACALIADAEDPPSLAALARHAGLSPSRFHRVFKAVTGVTPKVYADAQRDQRLRSGLGKARSVTAAAYDAGFASSGRFYARSTSALGMTPSQYRAGGPGITIRFAIGSSSLGAALIAASSVGVCAVLLGDDPAALARDLRERFPRAILIGDDRRFASVVATIIACIETPERGCTLPLDVRGTTFQQRVWQALRSIPAGTTATYSEVAERIGAPTAIRAVARACAANALAVVLPCHRVVRTDGSLSGYRWGVERKRALLDRERARAHRKSRAT